jgi:hypothetical protein
MLDVGCLKGDTIREGNSVISDPTDMVIYRPRLNAKINRNFEVFTATDFLTAITQHIPDKGAQMVRYYGWYSNKVRGARQRWLPPEVVPHRPGVSPPPPLKLPSKRWRDLILRAWHVDENRCFPGRFEGGLLPGTGLLRPGLPRNRAASRALPGRSAAAARPRFWRWGKTARKPAKLACCRPPPDLAGWRRNE